jgi:hypothetical protein
MLSTNKQMMELCTKQIVRNAELKTGKRLSRHRADWEQEEEE